MGIPYHSRIVATPVRQTLKVTLAGDNERGQTLTKKKMEFDINPMLHCENWQTHMFLQKTRPFMIQMISRMNVIGLQPCVEEIASSPSKICSLEQDICSITHKYI